MSIGKAEVQLRKLWEEAFGEHNGFWGLFLETAYDPRRCQYLEEEGTITAALTWLDCSCGGKKMAYIYAVATQPAHRGKGLCRALLARTHAHLREGGYAAALLVPEGQALREMYGKLGYRDCTRVTEFSCQAQGPEIPLKAIGTEEYGAVRRRLLPEKGVLQEGENLRFLAGQAQFYRGEDCLMAAWQEDGALTAMELLGNPALAPRILKTLECWKGHFRIPGEGKPFAMGISLDGGADLPEYFGFAFD